MLCPCCGVPILETPGGHAGRSIALPRTRRRGGRRRDDEAVGGADADSQLVALLEFKHQQLAQFGLVEASDPLLEATNRKAD